MDMKSLSLEHGKREILKYTELALVAIFNFYLTLRPTEDLVYTFTSIFISERLQWIKLSI